MVTEGSWWPLTKNLGFLPTQGAAQVFWGRGCGSLRERENVVGSAKLL